MDVSTVKAEIKAWEREFQETNGRDPTIQDIKNKTEIATKYKLYKKLSKNTEKHAHSASEPPSTPTRSRFRSYQPLPSLLAQPRSEIATTAPLSSFNPFSPRKKKLATRNRPTQPSGKSSNLFKIDSPPLSPFLSLDLPKASTSSIEITPPHSPSTATDALSRARKRLRGESVSPSPIKTKRRQMTPTAHPPFANSKAGPPNSDEGKGGFRENIAFVSDSPVKAPPGAKVFKVLFNEAVAAAGTGPHIAAGKPPSVQFKGFFAGPVNSGLEGDASGNLDSISAGPGAAKHKAVTFKPTVATSRVTQPSRQETLIDPEITAGKRPLSDTERNPLPTGSMSLLPPSPSPPNTSSHRSNYFPNAKGKRKAALSKHKKARIAAPSSNTSDRSGGDTDSPEPIVKIASRKHPRRRSSPDLYSDTDPMSNPRLAPHGPETPSLNNSATENFEVDLPDKLRNVLALETSESQTRRLLEERLVRELVSGRRIDHYNPAKGGEIWDAGEDDSAHDSGVYAEDENEWEGEPVPWEVGEL